MGEVKKKQAEKPQTKSMVVSASKEKNKKNAASVGKASVGAAGKPESGKSAESKKTVSGGNGKTLGSIKSKIARGTRGTGRKVAAPSVPGDLEKVKCVAEAMIEKKGDNVVSMDLRKSSGASFDFFVICQATSGPQVRAIADQIQENMYKAYREFPLHEEGYSNAEWVLLDYGGVVAHVFLEEVRRHYKLEELWGDARLDYYKEEDFV